MGENVKERVREIICDQLGCRETEITDDSTISDLGADSMDVVELILAYEEEWGLNVHDDDYDRFNTVKGAVRYILEHKKDNG